MEYRKLGATGLKVSELSLGCMTFGRESSEEESRKIIDKFIDVGGNFLDTANVYAAGASEEILGRALKHHRRDNLVVATKVRFNAKLFTGGDELTEQIREIYARAKARGCVLVDERPERRQDDWNDVLTSHVDPAARAHSPRP